MRRRAVTAIGEVRLENAEQMLMPLLGDPDEEVRDAAVTALRRISGNSVERERGDGVQ